MQAKMTVAVLLLAASTAGAAPAHHSAAGMAKSARMQPCCPMCAQMMKSGQKMPGMSGSQSGGMMGGMMSSPMMGQMQKMSGMQGTETAPTVTVANDGMILVLRGGTLYKYSADLKLLGSVRLPASAPAAPMKMDMEMTPSARSGR